MQSAGRYFVSDQQEKAAKFDLLLQRTETQAHLDALREEAHKRGEQMAELGKLLCTNPEAVAFQAHSRTARPDNDGPWFSVSDFDVNRIVALTDDIRTTVEN